MGFYSMHCDHGMCISWATSHEKTTPASRYCAYTPPSGISPTTGTFRPYDLTIRCSSVIAVACMVYIRAMCRKRGAMVYLGLPFETWKYTYDSNHFDTIKDNLAYHSDTSVGPTSSMNCVSVHCQQATVCAVCRTAR